MFQDQVVSRVEGAVTESIKQDTIAKDRRRSIQPHRMRSRRVERSELLEANRGFALDGDHALRNKAVSSLSDVTVCWGLRTGMAILWR